MCSIGIFPERSGSARELWLVSGDSMAEDGVIDKCSKRRSAVD